MIYFYLIFNKEYFSAFARSSSLLTPLPSISIIVLAILSLPLIEGSSVSAACDPVGVDSSPPY
jgi:hypothetical protein